MSSPLYLLDTNIILALVRGNSLGSSIDNNYGLQTLTSRPLVCVVTHGEIRVLAGRNGWGEQKLAALQNALDNLVTVDISSQDVLDAYVEIDLFSQAHPDGARNMGKNDLWIAACAKVAGAKLLTTDNDFEHLDVEMLDVDVIDPATGQVKKIT